MDSGNSGSISSSGDEEYVSSPAAAAAAAADHSSSLFLTNHFGSSSSHDHHHHPSLLFDLSSSYLHGHTTTTLPQSQAPIATPHSMLINLDHHPAAAATTLPYYDNDDARRLLLSSSPVPSNNNNNASAAAPSRNPKKRTRASRRAPTTVLTTDTTNFRSMVQEFTGIPTPPAFSAASSPYYYSRRLDNLFPISSSSNYPLIRPFPQKQLLHSSSNPPFPLSSNNSRTTLLQHNSMVDALTATITAAAASASSSSATANNFHLPTTPDLGLPYHHHQPQNMNHLSMQNHHYPFDLSFNPPLFNTSVPEEASLPHEADMGMSHHHHHHHQGNNNAHDDLVAVASTGGVSVQPQGGHEHAAAATSDDLSLRSAAT